MDLVVAPTLQLLEERHGEALAEKLESFIDTLWHGDYDSPVVVECLRAIVRIEGGVGVERIQRTVEKIAERRREEARALWGKVSFGGFGLRLFTPKTQPPQGAGEHFGESDVEWGEVDPLYRYVVQVMGQLGTDEASFRGLEYIVRSGAAYGLLRDLVEAYERRGLPTSPLSPIVPWAPSVGTRRLVSVRLSTSWV